MRRSCGPPSRSISQARPERPTARSAFRNRYRSGTSARCRGHRRRRRREESRIQRGGHEAANIRMAKQGRQRTRPVRVTHSSTWRGGCHRQGRILRRMFALEKAGWFVIAVRWFVIPAVAVRQSRESGNPCSTRLFVDQRVRNVELRKGNFTTEVTEVTEERTLEGRLTNGTRRSTHFGCPPCALCPPW